MFYFHLSSNVECCISSGDKKEPLTMALMGNEITQQCKDTNHITVKQCQLEPVTGPFWATTTRCPKKPTEKPLPSKDKLKGLEKVDFIIRWTLVISNFVYSDQ